ncbi:transposase [Arenibaculum sp.]|uniref:transposase n=1 Tax=Arenibaculum sp. TaxID=2865862 RepID=UPI0039C8B726
MFCTPPGAGRLAGRPPRPHTVIIDSQTVRTSEAGGVRGCDSGKRMSGRKRHPAVDTQGLFLHTAQRVVCMGLLLQADTEPCVPGAQTM